MKVCDIALFNPRGHGEAFPASILEWMSLSIPVISCLDYGCADVMTYNKFLTISNANKIETINIRNKLNLFSIFDFIHFNFGPIAIIIKNGIKNGIISL